MQSRTIRPERDEGFTLIEMLIVVAIIGILSSIAIPILSSHQFRTKATEAKTNIGAIRVVEEASFSESGVYLAANAEPAVIPGTQAVPFDVVGSDYAALGWAPEGRVYFSYAVAVSPDATGYTVDAASDIDGDGVLLIWGYTKPDSLGGLVAGGLGCDPTRLVPEVSGSCVLSNSIF